MTPQTRFHGSEYTGEVEDGKRNPHPDIVDAMRGGNEAASAAFVEAYGRLFICAIRRVASMRTGQKRLDPDLEHNCVTSLCLKAYSKLTTDKYDSRRSTWSTFVYSLAHYTFLEEQRRFLDSLPTDEPLARANAAAAIAPEPQGDDAHVPGPIEKALEDCLASLSDRHMRIWEDRRAGISYKEMAAQLGKTPEARKQAFSRVKEILKDCIKNRLA